MPELINLIAWGFWRAGEVNGKLSKACISLTTTIKKKDLNDHN